MKTKQLSLIIPSVLSCFFCTDLYATAVIGGGGTGTVITNKCSTVTCPSNPTSLPLYYIEAHCTQRSATAKCIKKDSTTYYYKDCTSCNAGYTLKTVHAEMCADLMNTDNEWSGGPDLKECRCVCNSCDNDYWAAYSTGYQRRLARWCDCTSGTATCKSKYEYQCAAGYYGTSSNGTSGCSLCPTWTGVYTNSGKTTLARGTTKWAGSSKITSCYVAAGTYYDATGTFKISDNCPYK